MSDRTSTITLQVRDQFSAPLQALAAALNKSEMATEKLAAESKQATNASSQLNQAVKSNAQAASAAAQNVNQLCQAVTRTASAKQVAADASRKLSAAMKEQGDNAQTASRKNQEYGQTLNQMVSGLGVQLGVAGLTAMFAAAGKASIKLAMDFQQTELAFKTLTGSAELATAHLKELRDFAAKTPFAFEDLVTASRRMQAFGFEAHQIVPMLTDIGDAVAAMGGSSDTLNRVTLALGQMQTRGKVTAQEMMQLTEVGIPAWAMLAKEMGVTTGELQDMVTKGLVPADEAIRHILAGMRENFGGMMAEQSKTAAGALSNMTDSLKALGTELGTLALPALTSFFNLWEQKTSTLIAANEALKTGAITLDTYLVVLGMRMVSTGGAADYLAAMTAEVSKEIEELPKIKLIEFGQAIEGVSANMNTFSQLLRDAGIAGQSDQAIDAYAARWQGLADQIIAANVAAENSPAIGRLLSAGMGGALGDAQERYRSIIAATTPEIARLRGEIEKYTAMQGMSVTVTGEATTSSAEYELAAIRAAEAAKKVAEFTGDSREEYLELVVAADKAQERVVKLGEGFGTSETFTLNYTKKLAELNGALDENVAKNELASLAMEEATKQFIYQQAAVMLTKEAALELAFQMGLIDEASYAAALGIQNLTSFYDRNKDGAIDAAEAQAGFYGNLKLVQDTINALQDKNVTVTISTFHKQYYEQQGWRPEHEGDTGAGGEGNNNGGTGTTDTTGGDRDNRAGGGHFTVPMHYPNDSYKMGVEAGEQVTVRTARQQREGTNTTTHNMGGVTIIIQQAPGQSARAVAEEVSTILGGDADKYMRMGTGR